MNTDFESHFISLTNFILVYLPPIVAYKEHISKPANPPRK